MSRLLGMLNDQSITTARRADEIKLLPLECIVPNEANFYSMGDLEPLAADIQEHGLLHNLIVRETDDYGVYKIIDGERRYRALLMNGEKYAKSLILDARTDAEAEFVLIQANATQRRQTDADRATAAVRLLECYKQLRKEGYEFKGRTRELVAKVLDVSPAQVGRYEKIERELMPELKEEFKAGRLGVTDAYDLATQDSTRQAKAAKEIKDTGKVEKRKRAPDTKAFELEKIMQPICDDYCRHPREVEGEDELEDICKECYVMQTVEKLLRG